MASIRELVLLLGLGITALVVGLWADALGWSLFIALSIWVVSQYLEFTKLRRWSTHPLRRPENGSDSWFDIAYVPYRALLRQRARTRQMVERFRQILGLAEFVPDGVIVLGPAGEIEGFNQAAKQLMQLDDRDVGIGLATVFRHPDFVAFLRSNEDADTLEFVSPADEAITLEARQFVVGDEASIVLIRDTTSLNKVMTMRQSFVANVSHELRTPLAVVKGYLETMTDPQEEEAIKLHLIDRLVAPVERLNSLVNDLMLLTQLESSEPDPDLNPVDLTRVIHHAIAELGGLQDVACDVHVDLADGSIVAGVESELQSVCVNLISNALRYGAQNGDIWISCRTLEGQVILKVEDNGAGIAPEHLSRLTERFYKVDLAGAGARGGTGLGLAIVKHVLRRHGSVLEIESNLGTGSRFTCAFPEYRASRQKE